MCPHLMPCRWEDGWPILGDADGRVPECMEMPASGEECKESIMGSDVVHRPVELELAVEP